MNNIKNCFSETDAKKILANKENAINYLILSPNNKLDKSKLNKLSTSEIWKIVVESWNYETGRKIIRQIFKSSEKYKAGIESAEAIDVLLQEWKQLNFDDVKWPCSQ
jgi:hypothetical protein